VKQVFVEVQHDKCAYCERQLASPDRGGQQEHDVEHFRPKSAVDPWPGSAGFKLTADTAEANGYYWLAYHLGNYCVACKKCNNHPQKGTYFPVRNARVIDHTLSPTELNEREKPLLVNPVGDENETDDPAELITFLGFTAVPVKQTGANRTRAKVIIEFFRLNDREELKTGRMRVIVALGVCLQAVRAKNTGAKLRADAQEVVELAQSPTAPHSGCATAFVELYSSNRQAAEDIADEARQFLKSLK
jgi:hypothetical protein